MTTTIKIEKNKPLQTLNTFGVEARAAYFAEARSEDECRELLGDARFAALPKRILGGGSNILLTGDLDGLVVKNAISGIAVTNETGSEVVVKAGAGVVWHDLVMWCVERNYAGLENLALIPGLVGASPVQNIGAYGVEVKDTFEGLEALLIGTGEKLRFSKTDCAFGYRDSVFKHKLKGQCLITSVSFRLVKLSPGVTYRYKTEYGNVQAALDAMKASELSLRAVSDAICQIRRAKLPDPAVLGNAGSFFKNPSIPAKQYQLLAKQYPAMPHYPQADGTLKIPAGWLIESCGWKGKREGAVGCHKDQALVLVNYGGAQGSDILAFAAAIQKSVKDRFGIDLSPEVNLF